MRIGQFQFRPRLIPTLVTMVLLPLLISLGIWQLNRTAEKRAILAEQEQKKRMSPLHIKAEKFSQDDRCKAALLATGTKVLHEAALDRDFGIGFPMFTPDILEKRSAWGSDFLGKALGEIKSEMM